MQNLNAEQPLFDAPGDSFAPMPGTNGSDTWEDFLKRTAGGIIDIIHNRTSGGDVAATPGYVPPLSGVNDKGEAVLLIIGVLIVILIATSK